MRVSVTIVVLAFCLSAVSVYAGAPAPPNNSPCNCQAVLPSTLDTQGTEKSPLTVRVAQMPAKTSDEIEQDRTEWREKISTDNWTIRLTSVTAVILGLQLIVFGIQAHRLNQSIKEAQRATEATLTAARAAEQTVLTMNLTARRDLRAYVAVWTSSIEHLDENGYPRANLTIKNFGKTPAYSFAVSADIAFVRHGEKPPEPREPAHVVGHLAPGGEYEVVLDAVWMLGGAERYQVTNSAAAVYVAGLVRYIDAYGRPRFTRFCVLTDGKQSVPAGRLISCASGNDTDDDAEIAAAAAQYATNRDA